MSEEKSEVNCDPVLRPRKTRRGRKKKPVQDQVDADETDFVQNHFKDVSSISTELDKLEKRINRIIIHNHKQNVQMPSTSHDPSNNISPGVLENSQERGSKLFYTLTENGIKFSTIPDYSTAHKSERVRQKKKSDPKRTVLESDKIKTLRMDKTLQSTTKEAASSKRRAKKKENCENSISEENTTFDEYMPMNLVTEGLQNGSLIQGPIRINVRNFKESYVTNPIKSEQDIFIDGIRNRNRSLEGDIVIVQLNSSDQWRSNNQKTGKVVFIKEKVHTRNAIGVLKLMSDKNHQMAMFSPRDSRVPRIHIPYTDWPSSFYHESKKYEKTLFLAKIVEWTDTRHAIGTIVDRIGQAGDLKNETRAILLENGLDVTPYDPKINEYFPNTNTILDEEFTYREDLRTECIFTIDPLTARDLDDAVSCKPLPNGNLEVGVHISDVSYYLKENTPLNQIVAQKATSIYLVESVYHMLPKELCLLCSLLPGEDKLAFSVFWEMTPEGEVLNYRFTRTIINSCCQLAYEHVQEILDKSGNGVDVEKFPKLFGPHTYNDIIQTVLRLQNISSNLRSHRFTNGSLRIDQPKLMFHLHPETGLPESFSIYVNQDSHRLIEELMLLANITVATKLHTVFPDLAFLRCHPFPSCHLMETLKQNFEKIGIHLDISTAGSLHKSMEKYNGSDLASQARMFVINAVCAKPMARAKYFCSAYANDKFDYWHYALNVPLYTHFTSPIRRYADIMVHRLLAAHLGYIEKPDWLAEEVAESAAICNKQKHNAKRAGEQSSDLYLAKYIEMNGGCTEFAVVVDVKDKSFDIIVMGMGINLRIYVNNLSPAIVANVSLEGAFTLLWPPATKPVQQIIEIFSVVQVRLTVTKNLKIEGKLLKPITASAHNLVL